MRYFIDKAGKVSWHLLSIKGSLSRVSRVWDFQLGYKWTTPSTEQ